MDIDFNAILEILLPAIIRIVFIMLATLGVVYMAGRLLFPKMKPKGKNIVAFFALIIFSYAITLVADYPVIILRTNVLPLWEYIIYSFVYAAIGAVPYIIFGWRLYSRMDDWQDRKLGKDNRRKK